MNVVAYAWIWAPVVIMVLAFVGYGAVEAVSSEQERRRAQGLPPLRVLGVAALGLRGAVLVAIGLVVVRSALSPALPIPSVAVTTVRVDGSTQPAHCGRRP